MYRQILVFSDVQGKSITWRLSAKKNVPLPKKIDVYRASLGQIIWYSVDIMKMRTAAYEGVVGNIKLVLGKSLRLNLKCRPSICL